MVRVLFVSDTHLGIDMPARPRVERRRRGDDFFRNFERALAPAHAGQVDVVVHGGDLLYRSRVPVWLAEAALSPLKVVASLGIPVLLVPGNHERARIPYPLLSLHEGLHIFDRPRTFLIAVRGLRVAFSGFPYTWDVRARFRDVLAEARRDAPAADVRVLCVHHCVEGATCGPGDFMFTHGSDVIRTADLPVDTAVTLSGHIHRHQVLHPAGRGPVVYAGSVERTSFAEAPETKGFAMLELSKAGLERMTFHPLPTRPMMACHVSSEQRDEAAIHSEVAAAIAGTPDDAVVQVRVTGPVPASLSAAALRAMAGERTVSLAWRPPAAVARRLHR